MRRSSVFCVLTKDSSPTNFEPNNSEIRGIYNYYCIANNVSILNSFYQIMKESMYKTFSSKYNSTVRKIINSYTRDKIFRVQYEFAGHERYYMIGGNANWANIRGIFQNNIEDLQLLEESDWKASNSDVWGVSDLALLRESVGVSSKNQIA